VGAVKNGEKMLLAQLRTLLFVEEINAYSVTLRDPDTVQETVPHQTS
jgi:hypothetical protein